MIDRYDAVAAMDSLPVFQKREVLIQVYGRERFFALRAEAARQLASDSDSAARECLVRALADPSPEVRSAALSALEQPAPPLAPHIEALLRDSSYAVVDSALGKLVSWFPERLQGYLDIIRDDRGTGNHLLVRRHELAAHRGSRAARDSLVDLAGPWVEFRTRLNALQALQRLNECPESLVPHLFDAMTHWNTRLRAPASAVASAFASQTLLRERLARAYRPADWRPWQQSILEEFLSVRR